MMDKGIQAVTMELISDKRSKKGTNDLDELSRVTKLLAVMECLLRGFDQLDE